MNRAILLFFLLCVALLGAIQPPHFYARRDYPSAGGIVAVGDVTGDGIPDVVAVAAQYSISTLVGNGNGTFRTAVTTVLNWEFTTGTALGDLNGDGKMDLVIGGSPAISGGISVLLSNGDGTFQQPVLYQAGTDGALGNAVIGDFNGDGILDVIAPGPSGIWLYTGKGGGVFNSGVLSSTVGGGVRVAAADFNRDGKLDLVVSIYPSGLYVLLGNGNATFQTPILISNRHWGYVATGDVSGNGYSDIILPGLGINTAIYFNNGQGQFPFGLQVPLEEGVAAGDLNGDHIPDLVSSQGCLALGLGGGKFAVPLCQPVANTGDGAALNVVLANLTGSGKNDAVIGLNATVSVLLNQGNGSFVDGEWISLSGAGNCGAAADFNGDGKSDLAVPTGAGMTVLFGTGNASAPFATGPSFAESGVGCPITVDVNGDGIADLVVGANGLGGVGVYLGEGDGTFTLASVIPFGPATNLVFGDFNHDGKVDVATSSNQLALGNGDGTFQSPVPILANPPSPFNWIAAGDMNKDGWTDIMAAGIAYVYRLLNDQQGGFTLSTIARDSPTAVLLADLNGDGNLDAVITTESANVAIYLGNGKGGF